MGGFTRAQIQRYLESILGYEPVVLDCSPLSTDAGAERVKGYGYGIPLRVDYQGPDGQPRTAVLHTMSPGPFGHELMSDRAQELLWEHSAFNRLPQHVRSLDVAGIQSDGALISLGRVEEFCLLTEYALGQGYFIDLERLRDGGALRDLDLARADALCDYLVDIHRVRGPEPALYVRRIRELVGAGECIMGLIDSYSSYSTPGARWLERLEKLCVDWRWRLKPLTHRLRQVHGDFHPWNILFQSGVDFSVLDRSRGEYGDAADDVACLTANYVFFSLQHSGRLEGTLETLFRRFWDRYLVRTDDREILRVIAPFYAFRALVMASPLWYPNLDDVVRQRLFAFMQAILEKDSFNPAEVNKDCGA